MSNREFAKEMRLTGKFSLGDFFLPVNIFDFPTDLIIAGFEMFHSHCPSAYLSELDLLYYEGY